jgi:magnesium-transporting ATPase (P-type)
MLAQCMIWSSKSRLLQSVSVSTSRRPNQQKTQALSRRLFSAEENHQRLSKRPGGLFIGLGWALLGLVVVDQALQYKQEWEANDHRNMLRTMQLEADAENRVEWDMTLPTLFKCKITHTEHSLDGTKMLRNIRVGDVVEVMQAETGPNQAYHLCRVAMGTDSMPSMVEWVGWYPIDYLQEL